MTAVSDKENVEKQQQKSQCIFTQGSLKRRQPEAAGAENSQLPFDRPGGDSPNKRQRSTSPAAVTEQPDHGGSPPTSEPAEEQQPQQQQPASDFAPASQVAEEVELPAAASPAACTPGNEGAEKAADSSGGGSWQPTGVGVEGLPGWCDRPLVTRQHFPEEARVDAFCYLPGHPLLALAAEGQAALLHKVLEHGADPDAKDSRGYTALHLACWHASLSCIRVLLEAGASLQVYDGAGWTARELVQAAGHADVEAMLQWHEEVQQALRVQQQQQQQQHRQDQSPEQQEK